MTLSLLDQPLFRVRGSAGGLDKLSLPQVLARLACADDLSFIALRPHQRAAWHAFLVTLAFLALEQASLDTLPTDAAQWRRLLRELTAEHPDDAPWHLVVDDWTRPAFLQSPCLPGCEGEYRRVLQSAQEIDLLVTSKNHDEKAAKVRSLGAEDVDACIYALISLQGFCGFLGAGNFNTMRMNGGFGSRAQFRLVFETGSGAEFRRDVNALLACADALWDEALQHHRIGTQRQLRLLWLQPWGDEALPLTDVHPLCIEVSRRIRLRGAGVSMQAMTAASSTARVAAKDRNGWVLDPWLPTVKDGGVKALTATADTFSYRLLSPILFDAARYELPVLAKPQPGETGAATLVAQVLVGGQGKTDGYLRREVRLPPAVLRIYGSSERHLLALRSRQFIDMAGDLQGKVLRSALLQFVDGSADPSWKSKDFGRFVAPWVDAFEQRVDEIFYPLLFETVDAAMDDQPAQARWLQALRPVAWALLEQACEALPTRSASRLMAAARAERLFVGGLYKHFGTLLPARPAADEVDSNLEPKHAQA